MFMRHIITIACLGLANAASENNSVVSLFIYGADQQSLVGSVIESRSEIATYSINCPTGTNSSDCGVSSGLLYTEGPTTVQWELQTPYDAYVQTLPVTIKASTTHNLLSNVYGRVICSTGGTTTAVCTEVTPTNGSTAVTSETTALNSDQITLLAVTITARANTSSSNATVTAITTTTSTATNSSDMAPSSSTSASGNTVPISVPTEFFLGGLAVALIAIAL
ncbi:hypothetical protein N7488_009283 [Penicillium malachiteum]|nr:hypothetical protein N7488_009283 [Penicillium malachiteum]